MLLRLRLSHQVQLLLTNGAHASKAFIWHHQLAVAIPKLALGGECMAQNCILALCRGAIGIFWRQASLIAAMLMRTGC